MKLGHILFSGLLASGCGAKVRPSSPGPLRAQIASDKDSLFGDPGLVPTREGEHVRREIAIAGQIDRAILTLRGIEQARTNVELPRDGQDVPRVLVAARLDAIGESSTLRDQIRRVIRGIVGHVPDDRMRIVLADPVAPPEQRPPALPLLLAAGLLGLGLSTGVAADRLRRRVRRRPSRRR